MTGPMETEEQERTEEWSSVVGTCPVCGKARLPLRANGTMRSHASRTVLPKFLTTCTGTGRKAVKP